jgi:hypothetical protein
LDLVIKAAKSSPGPSASVPSSPASVEVAGFASSAVFAQLAAGTSAMSPAEKAGTVKKVKGIFQFDVKGSSGVQTWTLDLKSETPGLILGVGKAKPDIVINVGDGDMADLASGFFYLFNLQRQIEGAVSFHVRQDQGKGKYYVGD